MTVPPPQVRIFRDGVVDHGAAVAAAADRYPRGIGDAPIHQVGNTSRDIVCLAATAVLDVEIPKFLSVTGAAAVVRVQQYIALLRKEPGPRRESEPVLALGPSVNPKDSWIARSRFVSGREIIVPWSNARTLESSHQYLYFILESFNSFAEQGRASLRHGRGKVLCLQILTGSIGVNPISGANHD